MPQNPHKIAQSFIQAFNEVTAKIKQVDALAQDYKAKYQALNPDLAGTAITAGNLSDMNTLINSLNTLASDPVVATIESKSVPSHGTGALD
jgi:hypothetical protein